ncbi:MAG: MFS transporter [Nitrososphaerota archaeon]|nr:MFS transporter [Nitrososphaerota archaeon]MDG7045842.1 MFS transporter [Nitrososphaerota archaeon]
MIRSRGPSPVTYTILASRAIYSMFWVILAPIYTVIGSSIGIPSIEYGLISWAFILGAGIFQIPSGILTARVNAQYVYMMGLAILATSIFLTAGANSLVVLLLSRVIGGIGAAMFFSSAGYVLEAINSKHLGLYMGFYNAAFSAGAGIGLLWAVVYRIIYWRVALVLAGLIGIAFVALDYLSWARRPEVGVERANLKNLKGTLLNRRVILLAVMVSGFWGANYAAETLLPSYFTLSRHLSPLLGSYLTSIMLFSSLPGGFANVIYDRIKRGELLLFGAGGLVAVSFLLFEMGSMGTVIGLIVMGFSSTIVFSSFYSLSLDYADRQNGAIVLALINTVNMAIGMWISPVFSVIENYALPALWPTMAAITLVPLLPLLVMKKPKTHHQSEGK